LQPASHSHASLLAHPRRVNPQQDANGTDLVAQFEYYLAPAKPHRLWKRIDAAGSVTTYTYIDATGQIDTIETPLRSGFPSEDRITDYDYYPDGRLQQVKTPGNVITSYTYDAAGRLESVLDDEGYLIQYQYDSFDRLVRTTYPDQTFEAIEYDRLDPVNRRDRLGRWTTTYYDALRRPTSTRDPQGRVVTQEWCSCGSLDRLIDPNTNATTWERDIQGRVLREIRANGSIKAFDYHPKTGQLITVKQPKLDPQDPNFHQEIHYEYALDDRLTKTSYEHDGDVTPDVLYYYTDAGGALDRHGRLRRMHDATGDTTYSFHPFTQGQLGAGQLASVDGPLAGDTISYTYDELGRVKTRTLSPVTTEWTYDQQGRLVHIIDPIGTFEYVYEGTTGRVQELRYPNLQKTVYDYDVVSHDSRLLEIQHLRPGGQPLSKFTYTYDAVGNILTWKQQTDAATPQEYTFRYDQADQLRSAVLRTLTTPNPTISKTYGYDYDPSGNRTVEAIDNAVTTATYDNMNRLLSQAPGSKLPVAGTLDESAAVTIQGQPVPRAGDNSFAGSVQVAPGSNPPLQVVATDTAGNVRTNTYSLTVSGLTRAFAYDPNGKTYEWDAENRLITVKQGANTLASFTYDGNGRRATKSAGGVTTTYVYDGDNFLEERPSVGSTKRYMYGPGIDRPLARVVTGVTTYNVADHLGSLIRTTDTSGNPTLTRSYDPWGNLNATSATVSGYAFTGREWDPETNLYNYRARYYDPTVGRFLSEDPIASSGYQAALYAYVDNRPVTLTDPLGLKPGDGFRSSDAAVLDAVVWMRDQRYEIRWEFGGLVCEKEGCFCCTGPVTDPSESHVDVDRAPCKSGFKKVGIYHTHPPSSTGFSGKGGDTDITDKTGIPIYVWLTGNGYVVKYTGTQQTIAVVKLKR